MMLHECPTLLEQAHTLLAQEWWREAEEADRSELRYDPPFAGVAEEHHPVPRQLLPAVIELLRVSADRSPEDLEPAVRQLIADQNFIEESGDQIASDDHDRLMERYVAVLMRVLEQVRHEGLKSGEWSDAPVTPLMCG